MRSPALRGLACAACALALAVGTVSVRPVGNGGSDVPAVQYAFGLTAYAAETGETMGPNANGGLAFLTGTGLTDPERGAFTGCLFQIEGETIQTVALSINRGGLYRCRVHTNLTDEEAAAYRQAMEAGTLTPAAISQDENGVWFMPELTALGASVTENYDPETRYGFWVSPEEMSQDSDADLREAAWAGIDTFDGARLTVAVTYTDGTQQSKTYTLSTGRLRVEYGEDGTRTMLPQLAGDEEPFAYGIYASSESDSRWLTWPVQDSRTVSLSNPYGASSNGKPHGGIDIPAGQGAVILAAADGTVTETGFDAERGNYLVLDHGGGLTTVYACCRDVTVQEGDTVKAGAMIAAVGSTGASVGPHLHFEVRQDGEPQDPVACFTAAIRDTLTATQIK